MTRSQFESVNGTDTRRLYCTVVTVSLDNAACGRLDAVAGALGISRSAAARILINNGYRLWCGSADYIRVGCGDG